MSNRTFLFLQGNASYFYRRLGKALARRGHGVVRINTSGGEWVFWGGWNAIDYKGWKADFGPFVQTVMETRGVTDLILFGDCRTIHQAAIEKARALGVRVHVFEEGYLRPNWITLEREGVNGRSRLPNDPAWYRRVAATLPPFDEGEPVGGGLKARILYDYVWQLSNYILFWRYPRYRTHRPYNIFAEYGTWLWRLSRLKWHQREAKRYVEDLIEGGAGYFLFPLQLDSDSQVRVHSSYGNMVAVIEAVIDEFAKSAPEDCRLVIKNHPLDNGWINYRRVIGRCAARNNLGDRVKFIDGGDLNALLDHSRGCVLLNSTVGLTALRRHTPTLCLGTAIYDMAGLTAQMPLSQFWSAAPKPDPELLGDFERVVQRACLLNGNFYTETGVQLAVNGAVARLESNEDLLADAPKRAPFKPRAPLPAAADH